MRKLIDLLAHKSATQDLQEHKKKNSLGCFLKILVVIAILACCIRIIFYIPISEQCYADTKKYIDGYCVFVEVNEKYTILSKRYFGSFKFLNIIETKPIFLYDKEKMQIIKTGEIGWWVNADDLEISKNQLYFKSNFSSGTLGRYYTPSFQKPWTVNDINTK